MKLISGSVTITHCLHIPFKRNLEKRKKKKQNTGHPFIVQFRRLFFDTLVHAIRRGSGLA